MAGLAERLLEGEHKDPVIADCVHLIEDYVAKRGGIKGIGLRTGLAMIKTSRPDIVPRSTHWLLPQFLAALDPLHQRYQQQRRSAASFGAFLLDHREEAATALLQVADLRVDGTPNRFVKKVYAHLRGDAGKEVDILLPRLAHLIDRHLPATA